MKNLIILLLSLTFAIGVHAQTYRDGATVTANGITFRVELDEYSFVLYNAANVYDNAPRWRYKGGRELMSEDEYEVVEAHMKPGVQNLALRKTFRDVFIARMRASYPTYISSPLSICYVIGPEGDTLEVAFIMHPVPELLALPPEMFAKLEQNLKNYVKWEVNEFGKKLEFMQGSSFVHFTQVPLDSELHPIRQDLLEYQDNEFVE